MIKHTAPNNVLSSFNPIVSLRPKMKKLVNEQFLLNIAAQFFSDLGSLDNFEPLDMDKLKTEIDFARELNFVNTYLYSEIIEHIHKSADGEVHFRPKYVFTFDQGLTPRLSELRYPYLALLDDYEDDPEKIRYGCMRLGEAPVLYYIWIDLQKLIQFIKQFPDEVDWESAEVEPAPSEKAGRGEIQRAIKEIEEEKRRTSDGERVRILEEQKATLINQRDRPEIALQGRAGKLRINLQWDTTDDLDLHVLDPEGNEICYKNTTAYCQGKRGALDVDANAGAPFTNHPQENIVWDTPPSGTFQVSVHLYAKRDAEDRIPFTLRVLPFQKAGRIYSGAVSLSQREVQVVTFEFSEDRGIHDAIKMI